MPNLVASCLSHDLIDLSGVWRQVPIRSLNDFVTVAEALDHDVRLIPDETTALAS
jgi:hypothetical protein